jgi:hypothetical protein
MPMDKHLGKFAELVWADACDLLDKLSGRGVFDLGENSDGGIHIP